MKTFLCDGKAYCAITKDIASLLTRIRTLKKNVRAACPKDKLEVFFFFSRSEARLANSYQAPAVQTELVGKKLSTR